MENSILSYHSNTSFTTWTQNAVVGYTTLYDFGNIIANDGAIKNGRKLVGRLHGLIEKSAGANPSVQFRLNFGANFVVTPIFTLGATAIVLGDQIVEFSFIFQFLTSTTANVVLELQRVNGTGVTTPLLDDVYSMPNVPITFDRSLTNLINIEGQIISSPTTISIYPKITELSLI